MSGCGCGGGGGQQSPLLERGNPLPLTGDQLLSSDDCPYKMNLLVQWRTKLQNLRSSGDNDLIGITIFKVNELEGIVQSAINYPANLCFFSPLLAPIVPIIQMIDDL